MRKVLAALALVLAVMPAGARADHANRPTTADRFVKAGAHHPDDSFAPYTYTKFYPEHLKVHPGMTVAWEFEDSFAGLHTVTFGEWAGAPMARLDELPGTFAMNEDSWMMGDENRKSGACGRAWAVPAENRAPQPPCVLRPGGSVTSGLSDSFFNGYMGEDHPRYVGYGPFRITFSTELEPGTYEYQCKYHVGMTGTVEIVPPTEPIPTQEQIDAQVAEELAIDTQDADETFARLQQPRAPRIDENGDRVWTVDVGGMTDDGDVNFVGYFPSNVDARAGDRVEFVAKGSEAANTVTFPEELQGGFTAGGRCYAARCTGYFAPHGGTLLTFFWGCDTDGRDTGAPAAIRLQVIVGCPVGTTEWQVGPLVTEEQRAPGDIVATPATWHNSSLLVPESHPDWARAWPDGRTLPSMFNASFPAPGTFRYTCLIHPQAMSGTITVS